MTVAPRSAASGASSREGPAPAENRAMSTPVNASPVASPTGYDRPSISTVPPAERAEASRRSSPTGNSRSLRTWIIVRPTTPVAPTTATVSGDRVVSGMAPRGTVTGRARRGDSSGVSALRGSVSAPFHPAPGVDQRPEPGPRVDLVGVARREHDPSQFAQPRVRGDRPDQQRPDAPAASALVDEHIADPGERHEVRDHAGEAHLPTVQERTEADRP